MVELCTPLALGYTALHSPTLGSWRMPYHLCPWYHTCLLYGHPSNLDTTDRLHLTEQDLLSLWNWQIDKLVITWQTTSVSGLTLVCEWMLGFAGWTSLLVGFVHTDSINRLAR